MAQRQKKPSSARVATPEAANEDADLVKANGRLNVRTQYLLEKLRKRGTSPEEFLASVIDGKVGDYHPLVTRIMDVIKSGKSPTRNDWNEIANIAREAYAQQSFLVYVPLDLRVGAAMKMMPHLYPVLKAATIEANLKADVKIPVLRLQLSTATEGQQ